MKKSLTPIMFPSHMRSTMGTLHCLDENILLTVKNKYNKSSAKRQIVTQKIQKIMVDLHLPKWMEESIGVRLYN